MVSLDTLSIIMLMGNFSAIAVANRTFSNLFNCAKSVNQITDIYNGQIGTYGDIPH